MKEGKLVNGRFYTNFELRQDVMTPKKHLTARSRKKLAVSKAKELRHNKKLEEISK